MARAGTTRASSTAPSPTSTTRRRRATTAGSRLASSTPASRRASGDVAAVRRWLSSQGFASSTCPANRLFVDRRRAPSPRSSRRSASTRTCTASTAPSCARRTHDPAVPAAVAPLVSAITGLDGAMALAHPNVDTPPPPPAGHLRRARARSYWGQRTSTNFTNPYGPGPLPWLLCGYQPAQIDSAYGIDRLHARRPGRPRPDDRDHRRVLLADDPQGRRHFSHRYHLDRGHRSATTAPPPSTTARSWRRARGGSRRTRPRRRAGTSSRRSTSSGRTRSRRGRRSSTSAPPTTPRGLDQALNYAVDNHVADVISNCWGLPEEFASRGEILALNAVFQQAAARASASTSPRATTATTARSSARARRASPTRARGSPRWAARAWRSGRDGQYQWEAGWGTTHDRLERHDHWRAEGAGRRSCTGRAAAPSHVFADAGLPGGRGPAVGARRGTAAPRRVEPDIVDGRRPADRRDLLADLRRLPAGHRRIIDSWIGGTSLSAPLARRA